jgi:uncharacterized protein (TIGR00725 family)
MELRQKPRVGVMGPSTCPPRIWDLAREVGACIAHEGAILVCGGTGGVMEAAACGAKSAGGITIGILPGASEADANPHIDIPIITDLGNARNIINVLTSHAIIAVAGAYGTLSEIALALKCGKPVVGLETWELIAPHGQPPAEITIARTPEEAVSEALRLIAKTCAGLSPR